MASQQVLNALEELHQELNKLEPAIKHIETAQHVTQTVKDIPKKHLELINDLKVLFSQELKALTTENKSISKTTVEIQTEVRKELEELNKLRQIVASFHDKVAQINFPTRLDKLDANIAGIIASTQNVQSRIESVEGNLGDKIKDSSKKQTAAIATLQDRTIEEMSELEAEMKTKLDLLSKKQNTNTYITWALIIIVLFSIVILRKH